MIGEGNFGNVHKGREEGGETFALKVTKDELSDHMKR
jgi:hypothetical protein